jgi:hypothetical protein
MKPKINLRLCIAGSESLLPDFEACLNSYLKFFDIGELLIYTTENLFSKVDEITTGKANETTIYDINKFYSEYYDKFPQSVKTVLDYSKDKKFKNIHSMFYLRMRIVMDYYLVKKPFILSDIDIRIYENVQPIIDWIGSDYILYNADYVDDYYYHSEKIRYSFGNEFFNLLPQFNDGWMCVPGFCIDIEKVFDILLQDMDNCPAEMAAIAAIIIKSKIKTKLLPRELMVTKESGIEGKTLSHLGPYGL